MLGDHRLTRDYPKDIKPLIMANDERIFYDVILLEEAGYVQKGTLQDYEDQLNYLAPEVRKWADRLLVWGKDDKLIVLTDYDNGTFGFGGWLQKAEE